MERLLIISADSHAGAHAADYVPYFDPQYREAAAKQVEEEQEFIEISEPFSSFPDEALDAIDDRNAIRSGGEGGGWDITLRLREMDAEGVAGDIVHAGLQKQLSPFFTPISRRYPADLRSAGARAHHRWFVDFVAPAKDRVFGVADPGSCVDMEAALAELHWCADRGFVAIGCPGTIWDEALPPLYDAFYEPFWRACIDRNLVLSVHTGWGSKQGKFFDFNDRVKNDPALAARLAQGDVDEFIKSVNNVAVDIPPRRVLWQLALGGVFDRYPTLKINFSEIRSDWLPGTLAYLDERFEEERGAAKMKPSEYFQRHGYVTPSAPRPAEISQRDQIGIERMMFGIDYPHPEGTWPNTLDWLRGVFADVTEHEARRFAGGNAVDCFGLDGDHLRAVAERIGPDVNEIIGGQPVGSEKIDHFHARAGYRKSPEQVDRELLRSAVDADFAGIKTTARVA